MVLKPYTLDDRSKNTKSAKAGEGEEILGRLFPPRVGSSAPGSHVPSSRNQDEDFNRGCNAWSAGAYDVDAAALRQDAPNKVTEGEARAACQ
jgi:hypothetical protein